MTQKRCRKKNVGEKKVKKVCSICNSEHSTGTHQLGQCELCAQVTCVECTAEHFSAKHSKDPSYFGGSGFWQIFESGQWKPLFPFSYAS